MIQANRNPTIAPLTLLRWYLTALHNHIRWYLTVLHNQKAGPPLQKTAVRKTTFGPQALDLNDGMKHAVHHEYILCYCFVRYCKDVLQMVFFDHTLISSH